MLQLTAVLAGGKAFKESVDAAVELTVGVDKLASIMGISQDLMRSRCTSHWRICTSAATCSKPAASKLTLTMNKQPEKLREMGVAIRDASGHARDMLDIMLDANKRLNDYTEGTDRNRASAYLFGKEWKDVRLALQLTEEKMEEGAAKAKELGISLDSAGRRKASRILERCTRCDGGDEGPHRPAAHADTDDTRRVVCQGWPRTPLKC